MDQQEKIAEWLHGMFGDSYSWEELSGKTRESWIDVARDFERFLREIEWKAEECQVCSGSLAGEDSVDGMCLACANSAVG